MNIKKIINDPRILLGIGGFFLGIGFIDVLVFTDASNASEMTWWGQASIVGFMLILSSFIVMPIISWVRRLFKKK